MGPLTSSTAYPASRSIFLFR